MSLSFWWITLWRTRGTGGYRAGIEVVIGAGRKMLGRWRRIDEPGP